MRNNHRDVDVVGFRKHDTCHKVEKAVRQAANVTCLARRIACPYAATLDLIFLPIFIDRVEAGFGVVLKSPAKGLREQMLGNVSNGTIGGPTNSPSSQLGQDRPIELQQLSKRLR